MGHNLIFIQPQPGFCAVYDLHHFLSLQFLAAAELAWDLTAPGAGQLPASLVPSAALAPPHHNASARTVPFRSHSGHMGKRAGQAEQLSLHLSPSCPLCCCYAPLHRWSRVSRWQESALQHFYNFQHQLYKPSASAGLKRIGPLVS